MLAMQRFRVVFIVEYQLVFSGIHTNLQASVYTKKTSDKSDIPRLYLFYNMP